jgi:fatty acid-binding protein DegV
MNLQGGIMSQVAVVTDSCASIPEEILKQLNIRTVAYYIHRGREVLRDLVTILDFGQTQRTLFVKENKAVP